jgi:rubrerythrin
MPEFSNAFVNLVPGRKVSDRELQRGIRLMIAAEHEAVHLYEALADATDNKLAAAVLQDIANEEKEHIGEFQSVLKRLAPDEKGFWDEGEEEVEELAEKTGG